MKKTTEKEAIISQKIMLEVHKSPWNLLSRRNVGDFVTKDGRYISIGKKGEADWQGILGNQHCPNCNFPIHPKPVAAEIKDENGKQTPDQIKWQNETWERRGALYVVLRSVDDAIEKLGLK